MNQNDAIALVEKEFRMSGTKVQASGNPFPAFHFTPITFTNEEIEGFGHDKFLQALRIRIEKARGKNRERANHSMHLLGDEAVVGPIDLRPAGRPGISWLLLIQRL